MSELSFPADMVAAIGGNMGTTEFSDLRKQWIGRGYTDLKIIWGATSIKEEGFARCNNLQEALIPPSVKKIGSNAFNSCKNLKRMVVPEGVTCIRGVSANCSALEKLDLPEGLITIGDWTFYSNPLPKLVIPSTVETIDNKGIYITVATKIYFKGTPTSLAATSITLKEGGDIYVPWSEGEVANAPWGATNATIHYNHTYLGE